MARNARNATESVDAMRRDCVRVGRPTMVVVEGGGGRVQVVKNPAAQVGLIKSQTRHLTRSSHVTDSFATLPGTAASLVTPILPRLSDEVAFNSGLAGANEHVLLRLAHLNSSGGKIIIFEAIN